LNQNSTTREYNSRQIAATIRLKLEEIPGAKIPGPRTILRWLKQNGYKNVKHTTKPGLNKKQMMKRLEFSLQVEDWTLEKWKKIVWSDETSVILDVRRGKRRVWRRTGEVCHPYVIRRRWKGFMSFMFWSCFCYDHKGPSYCWPKETVAIRKKYDKIMDDYNREHEAEDRDIWELETAMTKTHIDRNEPGRKPTWKYTAVRGKMVSEGKSGGIDWLRYQREVLLLKYIPFMKRVGADFIAQEDNAPSHASKWNRIL
jgi:hypothetical protein